MPVTGAGPGPVVSFAVSLSLVVEFLCLEAMARDGWNLLLRGHTLMPGSCGVGPRGKEGRRPVVLYCRDFSEHPAAALYVSLVRTAGRRVR